MPSSAVQIVVTCSDLDAALAFHEGLGFRLDMIMPADAPRLAVMSGHGVELEVDGMRAPGVSLDAPPEFMITRAKGGWSTGRAGMQYRDLIPGRLGGRVIASQIRIPDGGPVPDYVHYHHVRFQMIYCRRGWVRVVYEDQGPPFVMHEGDCVLQPPGIRHRVLEASAGLEVVEVSAPAEHETFRDHALALPTANVRADRVYGGQPFVRHVAAEAIWERVEGGFESRDLGIARATDGAARVSVLRSSTAGACLSHPEDVALRFLMVLEGRAQLLGAALGTHALQADDAAVLPPGAAYSLGPSGRCEVLEAALFAGAY
jgi:quercetin dioxygenase-like cupin family protein